MPDSIEQPRAAYFDEKGMLRDSLGRTVPTRFQAANLLPSIPGLLQRFRKVPQGFVAFDGNRRVEVACPCGETPALGVGEMTECACERFYVNAHSDVLVANSPQPPTEDDRPKS